MERMHAVLGIAFGIYLISACADSSATWLGIAGGGLEGNQMFARFAYSGYGLFIFGIALMEAGLLFISAALAYAMLFLGYKEGARAALIASLCAGAAAHIWGFMTWL